MFMCGKHSSAVNILLIITIPSPFHLAHKELLLLVDLVSVRIFFHTHF